MTNLRTVRKGRQVLTAIFGLLIIVSSPGLAQEKRSTISTPAPVYPQLARRLNLTGVVKIKAVVNADGTFKEAQVLGGHPLLVDAALGAVKRWKFTASRTETTEVIEFHFQPSM